MNYTALAFQRKHTIWFSSSLQSDQAQISPQLSCPKKKNALGPAGLGTH